MTNTLVQDVTSTNLYNLQVSGKHVLVTLLL